MNRGVGGGNSDGVKSRRRILRPLPVSEDGRSKERDEDLIMFRDMHKREKNDVASLFLPVSDEVEENGNYALYRMASGKKSQVSLDYLMTETGKNDYDWLKTPPATPLFPSLDMEANAPELVIQKEIPIILPVTLSRFAGKSGPVKTRTLRAASPNTKPKVSTRNLTQSGKQSASSTEKKNTGYAAATVTNQQKVIESNTTINDQNVKTNTSSSAAIKPIKVKDTNLSFLASNLSKTMEMELSSNTKPKSRGVSPAGRPKIVPQFSGFSDETPPNLRTDRSLSANRGRSINQSQSTNQRPGSSSSSSSSVSLIKQRRQSFSPSATRGPKQENNEGNNAAIIKDITSAFHQGNATAQVLGSRMVDKFLNARKSVHEEKETKPKLNGSLNESSGFGRHMSRISANIALKNMEIRKDSGKNGTVSVRKSSNIRGSRFPGA